MDRLPQLGRFLLAIFFAAFGIQYFLYGHSSGGPSPVPRWAPGAAIGARVATHLNNGNERTSAFVALALSGASFLLLPLFPKRT